MEDMIGVLIVEDQFLVALDLEHIIASAGYPVVGIATARTEIESLAVSPKIAFVDINLRDGPTGVEMAGQIAELAHRTLKKDFRSINTREARVILLDAAPAVLPPMGENLGRKAAARLEKLGVEIRYDAEVVDNIPICQCGN